MALDNLFSDMKLNPNSPLQVTNMESFSLNLNTEKLSRVMHLKVDLTFHSELREMYWT